MPRISDFMHTHFRHFNARETLAAAEGWRDLLARDGKMFLSMAGAMSTAELGRSLSKMIHWDKVHAICCTAANLEEDVFNLFAHHDYKAVRDYRHLSRQDEAYLRDSGFNRVTDTCIPETVMRRIEAVLLQMWTEAAETGKPGFPDEFIFRLLADKSLERHYQIPNEDSWVLKAAEKKIPIFTPGWEDSTLGNVFTAAVMSGKIKNHQAVHPGTALLQRLANWYTENTKDGTSIGFFQIGGGIAGDFAICVVPMLKLDMGMAVPRWAYFAQIGDSTTSYGSYSGASPSEKITWEKIDVDTPQFMINSDATIVAPLIFAYVLGE